MPTVLRVAGFQFRIYPADHQPPHIHAYKAGGVARIALSTPVIVISYEGMRDRDVIRTARIVEANVALLRREWRRIHG
jgi:hypothetical protein